jgi:thiol-disulfide isomerase/thioredoxin
MDAFGAFRRRTLNPGLQMDANVGLFSRRAVFLGLACMVRSSIARSQTLSRADAPPFLQTNRSQFIELQPATDAPALKLERIDGKFVELSSFRGKAVLISFWATWCPPCRRELPALEKLQQIIDPRLLEIVAVSIDKAGRPAVEAFLKRLNVTRLRPYLDPEGRIAKRVGDDATTPFVLYGMPISYVIDHLGRVAGYITGEIDWTSDEGLALLRYYMDT